MSLFIDNSPGLALLHHREIVAYADAATLWSRVVSDQKVQLVVVGSHGANGDGAACARICSRVDS